jgi:hypothetical protein
MLVLQGRHQITDIQPYEAEKLVYRNMEKLG